MDAGLCHLVSHGNFSEKRGAHLWCTFLRLEVNVHQPEAITAKPCTPLEVVHPTPLEVALDGHASSGGALELHQAGAKEHDAVGVVNLAIVGQHIIRRASVLRDEDPLRLPERLYELRSPVESLGSKREPSVEHFRV